MFYNTMAGINFQNTFDGWKQPFCERQWAESSINDLATNLVNYAQQGRFKIENPSVFEL
ncbi:MAG: hypothetical protein WCJ03_01710 [Bacteroidales bacterium]